MINKAVKQPYPSNRDRGWKPPVKTGHKQNSRRKPGKLNEQEKHEKRERYY